MNAFLSTYGPVLLCIMAGVSIISLLYSLVTAFWSVSVTMNKARVLWDESEQALYRLNKLLAELEEDNRQRKIK